MKKVYFLLYLVFPISLFAQSLNENAFIDFYLNNNMNESSLGVFTIRSYDGIAKVNLIKNIPSSWIHSYSLNHLPLSDRFADPNSPFGRNYIGIIKGIKKRTTIQFLSSHFGELDANLISNYKVSKKKNIQTSFLVNYHQFTNQRDKNKDNFLDLNKKKKFIGINNWIYGYKNFKSAFSIFHFRLNENGGENNFDKDVDYLTTNAYGLGQKTIHTGIAFKNDYIFKNNENQKTGSLFLDTDIRITDASQFYGTNEYKGNENIIHVYTGYIKEFSMSDFELGLHYRSEFLKETYGNAIQINRHLSAPSIYAKYSTKIGYKIKIQPDIRIQLLENKLDYFPSLKLTYQANKQIVLSGFTGRGARYLNVLKEQNRFLFSNRNIIYDGNLLPEKAWHYGISAKYFPRINFYFLDNYVSNFKFTFLFHHNIYQNINIVDIENPSELKFYNFNGTAFKTSVNGRFSFSPFERAKLVMMYRYDIFKTKETGELKDRYYYPRNNFMLSFNYSTRWFDFNTQYHLIGKTTTPLYAYDSGYSPIKRRWDISVNIPLQSYFSNRNKIKKLNIIIGADNITGKNNKKVILNSANPFGLEMDGGIREENALGGKFYGGLRIGF